MPDTIMPTRINEVATDDPLLVAAAAAAFDPAAWLKWAERIGYEIYLWDAYGDGCLGLLICDPHERSADSSASDLDLWWALRPNKEQANINENTLRCYLWDIGKIGPEEMRPDYSSGYTRADVWHPRAHDTVMLGDSEAKAAPAKWLQNELDRHRRFLLWDPDDKGHGVHYMAPSRTRADLECWRQFREYEVQVLGLLVEAARAIDARLGQADYPTLFDRTGIWLLHGHRGRTKLGGRIRCGLDPETGRVECRIPERGAAR